MQHNNTNKLAPATTMGMIHEQLELPFFDYECTGVIVEEGFSLDSINECNTSSTSYGYDPVRLRRAVKIICNTHGLHEHDVEGALSYIHVFGLDISELSTADIIHLWQDHCFDPGFDGAA